MATITAVAVAALAAVAQYTVGGMIPALERAPGGLPRGEWWRLVTPVFVQTDGWYQVAFNLVTLAVLGVAAEWLLGRWWWAALLAAGTAGGQIAAYWWRIPGGGSSIAICGLAAGIAIRQLTARPRPSRYGAGAAVYYIAFLTGAGIGGIGWAELAIVAAAIAWHAPPRAWPRSAAIAERITLAATAACAITLVTRQNLHGAALLTAMALTAAITTLSQLRHRPDRDAATAGAGSSRSRALP